MARNKRKKIKDKDKLKDIRKQAKKRWRNKKAQEKALKNATALKPASPVNDEKAKEACDRTEEKSIEPKLHSKTSTVPVRNQRVNEEETKKACERRDEKSAEPKQRSKTASSVKEINPVEIVRTEKSLGCGTFGVCYLAYYRNITVAVKEYRMKSKSVDEVKRALLHEARMINHLGDHRNVPLLFGAVTKGEKLQLITQFHGEKGESVTLSKAFKKKKLDKPQWLDILKRICEGLSHVHNRQILHNDLKSNNVLLEKQMESQWNPVIIDFGKARFITDPKPIMSLTASSQESYKRRYPHIAPEIVAGSGRQSVSSDVFSLGKILLEILNSLPTATATSLKISKRAILDNPGKRPSIDQILAVL